LKRNRVVRIEEKIRKRIYGGIDRCCGCLLSTVHIHKLRRRKGKKCDSIQMKKEYPPHIGTCFTETVLILKQ